MFICLGNDSGRGRSFYESYHHGQAILQYWLCFRATAYSPGCHWPIYDWSSSSWSWIMSFLPWNGVNIFPWLVFPKIKPTLLASPHSVSSQEAALPAKKLLWTFLLLPSLECVLILLLKHMWILHPRNSGRSHGHRKIWLRRLEKLLSSKGT